jgi:hypothetical protein
VLSKELGEGSGRLKKAMVVKCSAKSSKKAMVVKCSAKSSAKAVVARRRQWSLRGGSEEKVEA